mmetsp:Transcript_33096/g.43574  ORF Transcript_33096/g.43574 Transcript_33096/m.43574 type:complete len:158 (+) Transcript_33096:58-531(+)
MEATNNHNKLENTKFDGPINVEELEDAIEAIDMKDRTRNFAVSLQKPPNHYFNLLRRNLEKNETATLSALEGAMVNAVDAAFLLERAKIAKIGKVETNYAEVNNRASGGRILHRARLSIQVMRTEEYVKFLEEQAGQQKSSSGDEDKGTLDDDERDD